MNAKNWTFRLLLVVILNSNYLNNVFKKKQSLNLTNIIDILMGTD